MLQRHAQRGAASGLGGRNQPAIVRLRRRTMLARPYQAAADASAGVARPMDKPRLIQHKAEAFWYGPSARGAHGAVLEKSCKL
jgi:hypothetical protein